MPRINVTRIQRDRSCPIFVVMALCLQKLLAGCRQRGGWLRDDSDGVEGNHKKNHNFFWTYFSLE